VTSSSCHIGEKKLRGGGNMCDKEGKILPDAAHNVYFSVVKPCRG
jgi:hypothetical protein